MMAQTLYYDKNIIAVSVLFQEVFMLNVGREIMGAIFSPVLACFIAANMLMYLHLYYSCLRDFFLLTIKYVILDNFSS